MDLGEPHEARVRQRHRDVRIPAQEDEERRLLDLGRQPGDDEPALPQREELLDPTRNSPEQMKRFGEHRLSRHERFGKLTKPRQCPRMLGIVFN